jgi:LmbE family N-acetylglucosaminyl deacetylase
MSSKIALSLCAHPDDAEFMCTGTMALLKQKGWEIHIATMTPGDCGSADRNREEISTIRRAEAAAAAAILGGTYHCLEECDIFVMYDKPTLLKVIKLVREVQPTIMFAPSPDDYMVDHENTSRVVWNSCFSAGIPNVYTPGVSPSHGIPTLFYVDPLDAHDKLGNQIKAGFHVDVSSVIDTKLKMLQCHASQRDWLFKHHGVDEYTESLKRHGAMRGKEIGTKYAEAFRQHLGHGFPHGNILKKELGALVR